MAYTFHDYRLRAVSKNDRELLQSAINADDDHRGKVTPDFFLGAPEIGVERMVLEDKDGETIFFFRQSRALRIDIQFREAKTKEERRRNMEGLVNGFEWLAGMAQRAGYRQIIFQSSSKPLIKLCTKHLGFKESAGELICYLAPPTTRKPQQTAKHPVPDKG